MRHTLEHDRRVTVVVVHRDQPDRCVGTVAALGQQGVPVEIVVVDNGSTADSLGRLRAALPDVEVVETGANLGFGPAANVGIRRWLDGGPAAGEWVAVVPHDALPEPGCLARIVDAMAARPRAGLGSAEFGTESAKPVVDRYFGGIMVPATRGDGWEPAGFPHGTLLVARRPCIDDIGLFDERYFAYCEEADLGKRATDAGWEVGVVWGAVVRNPSLSVASPVAEYLQLRNSLLLVRDHFGRYPAFIRFTMAIGTTVWGVLRPASRAPLWHLAARRLALTDFLRGSYGPPPATLGR